MTFKLFYTSLFFFAENVKRSNSIDDEVFSLLEKMEALQNMVSYENLKTIMMKGVV